MTASGAAGDGTRETVALGCVERAERTTSPFS